MLNVAKMILDAEKCLGWPYVSPGTNDQNGIDCSGLFVRIFREQGAKIAHGSNTIYRTYCSEKGKIEGANDLIPGMAVFKWNANTPEKFKDDLGDFQHIGLVISGSPLKIIHASSAAGRVVIDEKLGKWKYWGMLKNVDYGQEVPTSGSMDIPEGVANGGLAVVEAEGSSVKMRFRPSNTCGFYENVPVGTVIEVLEQGNVWSRVSYGRRIGWYMMSKFLIPVGEEEDAPEENDEEIPVTDHTMAMVVSENGKPVKMRQEPSTDCSVYVNLPYGTMVELLEYGEAWSKISHGSHIGWYMMSRFLKTEKNAEENGYG